MQVVMVMFKSDGDRKSFSIHKDITVVGRREDCDLRIPLGEISRKHCRLIKEGETLRVEDLGSSNGTYHNGQRVQEASVSAGDTVQVGSIAFVVQIDNVPADDELQPIRATTSATGEAAATSESPVEMTDDASPKEDSAQPPAEKSAAPIATDDDEFDPMKFLEGGDSQSSQGPLDIDLESSQHGQE